ncbi:MAG: hypothetical protein GEU26_12060 [Nitrososphaeraceae archaeon]|nr:hypothetical protein [Nitrososphaeraceae archaeon]
MAISPFIDIFSITCDAIDCKESAEYEREITVLDVFNEPFTFTGYFYEIHKDGARTAWDKLRVSEE